jgi:hypothetical protein
LAALAGIVALAALGALAVFVIGGRAPATEPPGSAAGTRADDARKELEARKAALGEASREVLKPAPSAPPAPQGDVAPAADEVTQPPRTDATAARRPAPGADASTAKSPRPPARAEASKAGGLAGAPPAPGAKAATAASKPATPATGAASPAGSSPLAVTPAPVPTANAERWAQMNDEMSRCSSDSVIPRHQCERRIRTRYCDGWWGTVPECPASRSDVRN